MKILKTKQNISAYIALAYLGGLRTNAVDLFQDAEYNRTFKALENCINDMLDLPYDGDIIDEYIIVEQEDTNTPPNSD